MPRRVLTSAWPAAVENLFREECIRTEHGSVQVPNGEVERSSVGLYNVTPQKLEPLIKRKM